MGKKVKITIDGKNTQVYKGTNLIAAAKSAGIHIPNLCHVEGLKGIGACRLCLVEIRGLKSPVTACTTTAKEGMVVYTQTEQVREIRRCVIDLILSMHPLDCMTCTKAGVCDLQRYAYEFGIKKSSFTQKKFDYPVDDRNPFIKRDPDYCVLCGRCVRVCKQQGTSVLDFYGRGIGTKVMTAEDRPLQASGCTFCGSCLDACPVNALLESDRWQKGREWEYEQYPSICLSCGNACDTTVSVHKGQVVKVNAGTDARADHYICAYGRFGHEYIHSEKRIKKPLVRIGGGLTATNWEEAYHNMAEAFLSPHEVGIVTTGNLLNEDILTLKRFSDATGIENMTSTVDIYGDCASLLGGKTDIQEADLIVLVGLHVSQWDRTLPALDATLRTLIARKKTLISFHSEPTNISEVAHIQFTGDEVERLEHFSRALLGTGLKAPKGLQLKDFSLSENMVQAAQLYADAKNPLILSSPNYFEAAKNVGLIKGEAVSVPIEANAKGTLAMGFHGDKRTYQTLVSTGKKILFAAGDVPMRRPKDTQYLIVAASHRTPLAMEADLVLPIITSYETQGSIVDYLGRLKTLKKTIKPFGGSKALRKILEETAKAMSIKIQAATAAEAKKVYAATKVSRKPSPFSKRTDLEFDPASLIPDFNKTMIKNSRLLSLFDGTLKSEAA
jgi:NADH dehydrogenase/NADH:ubiquinone oxidoreductase subunit G